MTRAWAVLSALALGSCAKVPLHSVGAVFTQADAAWFAEEETLFVFYQVDAEQGLGDPSVIEIRYATDDERVDWTPVSEIVPVHTHVPVDCGIKSLCGSTSVHVPIEPREVQVRLRYHRDGELALEPETAFNVVGPGPDHAARSLVVYGVFDETNQYIQWRGRHQFPTVRNERATELGLRREFTVSEQRFGSTDPTTDKNLYGYGRDCADTMVDAGLPDVSTLARAVFHLDPLPFEASGASVVCAQATVHDALGPFTTEAWARKNPEVLSAFPLLRSPVHDARRIPFFLGPCDHEISEDHEQMQRQRLFLEGVETLCVDDWDGPGFVNSLVVTLRGAVEAERVAGEDMVLVIAVHRDEPGIADAVEEALALVVPPERQRTSPRLVGAFVFDSNGREIESDALSPTTLWCPSVIPLDGLPDASAVSCPTMPDIPELDLGPFTFGTIPILPSRRDYLDFLDTYSKAQAGEVTSLEFLAPEFAASAEHLDFGEFGVVTFLNGEAISADLDDAFSYCVDEDAERFVVRSPRMGNPAVAQALAEACYYGVVPYELCAYVGAGLLPIEYLPDWHNLFPETTYRVGLFWEFPFLLRMEYRTVLAGAVGAMGFSVPFGIASKEQAYYGTDVWLREEFRLEPALTQCKRFCDHPTFDSAGVYHPSSLFRPAYAHNCYVPLYPEPGDTGFPLDP